MEDHKQDNTLSIIALVVGGLGLLLSMIPCVGVLGVFPGIIGLILGLVAFFKAKDNGDKKTLSIIALAVSGLTITLAAFWYLTISTTSDKINVEVPEYTSCEVFIADMDSLKVEIKELGDEFEEDDSGLAVLSGMRAFITKVAALSKMENQAEKLGCDFERLSDDDKSYPRKGE